MKKEKHNEFDGFGITLTLDGPVYYYFNSNKTNMQELVALEMLAFINAKQSNHRLFKLYDTDSCGYTVVSFN